MSNKLKILLLTLRMTEHEKTCEYHFCNYKLWDETAFCIKSGDFERAEKKYEKLSEMPDGQEELTRRRFASVYEGICADMRMLLQSTRTMEKEPRHIKTG